MANTLVKLDIRSAPTHTNTDAVYITRTYLEERRVLSFRYVRVSNAKDADYFDVVRVDYPQNPGKPFVMIKVWYKRIPVYTVELVPVTITEEITPAKRVAVDTYSVPAWDASARSALSYPEPLEVSFSAATEAGGAVVAGLVHEATRPKDGGLDIVAGFKIEGATAYVHISELPGFPSAPDDTVYYAPYVSVTPLSRFRITAAGGVAHYFVDDVLVAKSPSFANAGEVHLGATLYVAGDKVTDPSIKALSSSGSGAAGIKLSSLGSSSGYAYGAVHVRIAASGEYRAPTSVAIGPLFAIGGDRQGAYANTSIGTIGAVGFGYTGASAEGSAAGFLALNAIGSDYNYSYGQAPLMLVSFGEDYGNGPHMEATESVVAVAKSTGLWAEGLATFSHRGVYSEVQAAGEFDAVVTSSENHAGAVSASMSIKASIRYTMDFITKGACRTAALGERVVDVALAISGTAAANHLGILLITQGLHETASASAALGAGLISDASLQAEAATGSQYSAQQSINAAIEALAYAGVSIGEPGKNLSVWSVNPKSGSAAYDNFPFNSFACIGGRHYGAASDGIYELVGDDDAGAPIQAHLNLGQRNFGTSKLKAMPYAYLGVASDGLMVVRVTTEGASYTYKARAASAEMQTQRVDFGRGLRANYFTLELMNENGADFDLDVIELAATPLTRRI